MAQDVVAGVAAGPRSHGVGEALEGRVRAVASAGRLQRLELEPRLMRLPRSELAAPIVQAAGGALAQSRAAAVSRPDASDEPFIAPQVLADHLDQARTAASQTMSMITSGLADAMARISQVTSVSGDPGPQGLEQVLESTAAGIELARTAPAAPEITDVQGRGTDPDGVVDAVVDSGGGVVSVTVADPPGRSASSSHVLGEQVVAAVNAALDDADRQQAEQAGRGGVEVEGLTERLAEVQDLSLQQMRTYTTALQTMMASIQGPPR